MRVAQSKGCRTLFLVAPDGMWYEFFKCWYHYSLLYRSNSSYLLFPYMLLYALIIPVVFGEFSLLQTCKSRRKYNNAYII